MAGVNLGEIWISLSPGADYTATLDRIQSVTNGYPGLFREVQTYLDERIQEVLTGGKEPIIVRTYGDDLPDAAGEIRPDPGPGEIRAGVSSTRTGTSPATSRR